MWLPLVRAIVPLVAVIVVAVAVLDRANVVGVLVRITNTIVAFANKCSMQAPGMCTTSSSSTEVAGSELHTSWL